MKKTAIDLKAESRRNFNRMQEDYFYRDAILYVTLALLAVVAFNLIHR